MKDLNNEYIELTEKEVPDLWARIEASIDALDSNATETPIAKNEIADHTNDNDNPAEDVKQNESNDKQNIVKYRGKTWRRYMPAILTAAMLFLSFSVYGIINSSKASEASSPAANSDMSYAEEATVAYESENEATYDFAADEATYEEASESYEEMATNEDKAISEDSCAIASEDVKRDVNGANLVKLIKGQFSLTDDIEIIHCTNEDGNDLFIYVPLESYEIVENNLGESNSIESSLTAVCDEISVEDKTRLADKGYEVEYILLDIYSEK